MIERLPYQLQTTRPLFWDFITKWNLHWPMILKVFVAYCWSPLCKKDAEIVLLLIWWQTKLLHTNELLPDRCLAGMFYCIVNNVLQYNRTTLQLIQPHLNVLIFCWDYFSCWSDSGIGCIQFKSEVYIHLVEVIKTYFWNYSTDFMLNYSFGMSVRTSTFFRNCLQTDYFTYNSLYHTSSGSEVKLTVPLTS